MSPIDNDSGIGSLHAHDEKEPTHAIAITPWMRTIVIKSGVLAVLSHFYGLSKECPYAFLEEFCRYCDIQPLPAGSTSEDYRLKAIPFVLKGDAGVWLSRLPEGLIVDSKNDLNLAAQGDFSKTPFRQAKNILERLIEAKRSNETSHGQYRRGAVHAVEARSDEKLEACFEQMEKKLLEAVEKSRAPQPPAPKEKQYAPPPPPPEEQPPQPSTQQIQPSERQPNWPARNPERSSNGGNRMQGGQGNWSGGPQGNWSSGGQPNWSSR
ncbi:uncharacterized protein LOC121804038 [Salvia splendens]|uniref:uncharacterized protein LOC121804038 n=1 Tax=Salvia splendens TaxID=180675 RepID=UPI001C279D71|nr:uncharacterized protein LOC121804038 [Salvia splendens]